MRSNNRLINIVIHDYSRVHLFTFKIEGFIVEKNLITFDEIFLIYKYTHSHLRDVFIHIEQLIFVHIYAIIGSAR